MPVDLIAVVSLLIMALTFIGIGEHTKTIIPEPIRGKDQTQRNTFHEHKAKLINVYSRAAAGITILIAFFIFVV